MIVSRNAVRRIAGALALLLLPVAPASAARADSSSLPARQPTADHARFAILKQEFKSGPEVTAACLSCHTEAAKQMMLTTHWTWRAKAGRNGDGSDRWVGKGAGVINNFCLSVDANEARCTSCHAGYGWKDKSFDFSQEQNVDCLVCHDTTGTYKKFPTDAGHPNYVPTEWPKGTGTMVPPPDLGHVARHVGRSSRATCGSCHFSGGGGEGVKHGSLDPSLVHPGRALDVHMDAGGANFACTECHTTVNHRIAGRYYGHPVDEERSFVMRGENRGVLGCESCHGATPHRTKAKLNDHTDKVSCQACHIPLLAPAKPTKMWWDWSQAGRRDAAGKPLVEQGSAASDTAAGRENAPRTVVYDALKGSFIWAWKAVPEYAWFNNHLDQTVQGDRIDDSLPGSQTGATRGAFDHLDLSKPVVRINTLNGDYRDPQARVWPVKIHRSIQPYDPVTKLLVIPKLYPSGTDAGSAFWKTLQWPAAIEAGMRYTGLPYSGRYDWIQTTMAWPLSHMVAPKEQALQCADCHRPEGGRLAGLSGFYMPARDRNNGLDRLGWLAAAGALGAVVVHGGLRFHFARRRRNR